MSAGFCWAITVLYRFLDKVLCAHSPGFTPSVSCPGFCLCLWVSEGLAQACSSVGSLSIWPLSASCLVRGRPKKMSPVSLYTVCTFLGKGYLRGFCRRRLRKRMAGWNFWWRLESLIQGRPRTRGTPGLWGLGRRSRSPGLAQQGQGAVCGFFPIGSLERTMSGT